MSKTLKSVTRFGRLGTPEMVRWLSKLVQAYGSEMVEITVTNERRESERERKYFEGAIVPYFCYLMPIYNPRSTEDRKKVRELVKQWFIGEVTPGIDGKMTKVCLTSRGKLKDLLDQCSNWFLENGYPVPDPKLYKKWRDVTFCEHGDYWLWLETNHLNVDGTSRIDLPLKPLKAYEPIG